MLYDRREDEVGAVDNTIRATVGTTILGANVTATVHNRENEQAWAQGWTADESEQKHTWIVGKLPVNLWSVPLEFEARYGMSDTAPVDNHSYFGVKVDKYPVGPLALSASYSTSRNDVEDADKQWWINSKWTDDKVDRMSLGVGYTLVGFFGTDVETEYEYALVYRNDAIDGSARNTFRVSFDKELRGGEARLSGEGKFVTGGSSDDKRDGTDFTGKLALTYPVFEGADLKLSGVYVSAKDDTNLDGETKPDYTVYQVKAGLEFTF